MHFILYDLSYIGGNVMEINLSNAFFYHNNVTNQVEQNKKNDNTDDSKEKFEQKAKSLGVPEHIVEQGRKAVEQWLVEKESSANEQDKTIEKSDIEKKAEVDSESKYKVSIFV